MKYLTPDEIRANKEILTKACLEEGDSGMVREGRTIQIVEKYIQKEASILDCGAGNGLFLSKLRDAGYRNVSGVDIDDYRVFGVSGGGRRNKKIRDSGLLF